MMSTFQRRLIHTVALPTPVVTRIQEIMVGVKWNAVIQAHASCAAAQQYLTLSNPSPLDVASLILVDSRRHSDHAQSFIQWLKGNPRTKSLPVVTIHEPGTIQIGSAYGSVNGSVLLDQDPAKESITLAGICRFWLKTNLPAPPGASSVCARMDNPQWGAFLAPHSSKPIRRCDPLA